MAIVSSSYTRQMQSIQLALLCMPAGVGTLHPPLILSTYNIKSIFFHLAELLMM